MFIKIPNMSNSLKLKFLPSDLIFMQIEGLTENQRDKIRLLNLEIEFLQSGFYGWWENLHTLSELNPWLGY